MGAVTLLDSVPQEEIIIRLLDFYSRLEKLLSTRLPHDIWKSAERQQGAKEALDLWLRTLVREDLQKLLPGVGLHWDSQIHIPPVYSTSSVALIDLVDGAKEYARMGTAVTSHLGVYRREGEELGQMQLGIVSYPFHKFRVLSVGEGEGSAVYYVPFEVEIMDGDIAEKLEKGRLAPSSRKKMVVDLDLVDRYKYYDQADPVRRNLDVLRWGLYEGKGRYTDQEGGSVAKTIVDVALGVNDVAICKHPPRAYKGYPPIEYLTPSTLLRNLGGIFTDLDGKKPDGKSSINGFIAAGNRELYEVFTQYLHSGS